MKMMDYEKLGVFYLGREYDLENKKTKENLILYDSKDLVTHAVCVGMTGSGKTGLCIGLLEEAALDNIPSIVVDPKGDLTNLLLTFPDLKAEDFLPWINRQDAVKKGLAPEEYADGQAALWREGLASWGMDSARIKRLKESAEFTIYTPGSSAGMPVSILKSFAAPDRIIIEDNDILMERIGTTVTSLLNLVGIEADPIRSREHILLSTLLEGAWRNGQDLSLAGLIEVIQSPPFARVGVFDLESFFPAEDRFSLAMKLNGLIAAPGFGSWLEGEPLDIGRMFHTDEGRPRVSIFSIAHLEDAERMFFVSLLLTQLLGWMRTQSGTTSLRSIFYMDEIFGYFPPVANPPSKAPLLSLMKQARAFGLGIVLSTQNPVDLDYKGLSNTGTWFLGRLQTERDKERVLDGLEGVGSSSGGRFNRQRIGRILTGLGKRVFLMNNVHEDEPVIFQTRWAMSYLRGPLTREQIKDLTRGRKASVPGAAAGPSGITSLRPSAGAGVTATGSTRPMLPPSIPQYFIPVGGEKPGEAQLYYDPALLCIGRLYFADAKIGTTAEKDHSCLLEFTDHPSLINWDEARGVDLTAEDLETLPYDDEAMFGDLPAEAGTRKSYIEWGRQFKDWLYRGKKLELYRSPSLEIVSQPGENQRDFRVRLQQISHEKRDRLVEALRKKYAARIEKLEERINRASRSVEKEKEQTKQRKLQTMISLGATIVTSMLGRKRVSLSTLGRAATTARRAGDVLKEKKDIERARESLQELEEQLTGLKERLAVEIEQISASIDPLNEKLDSFFLTPRKKDISVSMVALAWVPYWQDEKGGMNPAA